MLDLVRQIGAWAVAGAALYHRPGVGDGNGVLGVGVRKHPALIDHIEVKQRVPPKHLMALGLVVGGQLHQAQVRKVVGVHVQ